MGVTWKSRLQLPKRIKSCLDAVLTELVTWCGFPTHFLSSPICRDWTQIHRPWQSHAKRWPLQVTRPQGHSYNHSRPSGCAHSPRFFQIFASPTPTLVLISESKDPQTKGQLKSQWNSFFWSNVLMSHSIKGNPKLRMLSNCFRSSSGDGFSRNLMVLTKASAVLKTARHDMACFPSRN